METLATIPAAAGGVASAVQAVARDIVVIGSSAGGLEALATVVGGLPVDVPGAVFVVLDLPAGARGNPPAILGRSGPLPASVTTGGRMIRPGRVYGAPPKLPHLVVGQGAIHLEWRAGAEVGGHPGRDGAEAGEGPVSSLAEWALLPRRVVAKHAANGSDLGEDATARAQEAERSAQAITGAVPRLV